MKVSIFFSWQSDTAAEFNTDFISDALKKAIKLLKKDRKKIEFADLFIDRDTKNVPGWPNIPITLDTKIKSCQIFVADLTVTNQNNLVARLIPDKIIAPTFNTNVTYELGKAESIVGTKAVITVFNEHYHVLEDSILPFDIRQNRWPIRFTYSKKLRTTKDPILGKLANNLAEAIKLIVDSGLKNPQVPYYPFLEWEQWTRELGDTLSIEYETNDAVRSALVSLKQGSTKEQAILRLVGLSGLGKTRLAYEAFNPIASKNMDAARQILYLDLNTAPDFRDQIFRLSENGERKILILDNCDRLSLADIAPLVRKITSRLSLIAIDHNVPVSVLDQDSESININLKQEDFESIIDNILIKVFPGVGEKAERELIKQFAKGHTLIATILAQDKKQQKTNWRPIIKKAGVLEKILGEFGSEPEARKVLRAVSIFERLGHFEELSLQTDFVASNELLSNLDQPGNKVDAFKQVCRHYVQKGIMEKQARYLIIRTKPIALSLAIEWWEKCDSDMAKRVFDSLAEQSELKISLTEQLRYLDFLDNAREVVEKLVKPNGPFGTAEVLNTEEGSHLFRAFVEVNPQATTETLERIYLNKTKEELIQVDRGRRNLIWALEKLVFRSETFEKAAKVLLNFAVAENENISNNATGQFIQLFQAFLPGTQASYDARQKLIEYALANGNDFEDLGFNALLRGLKARDFHRGGGAENQGSGPALKDYPQTDEESANVVGYWKYCIDKVLQIALGESPYADSARKALIKSVRSFSSVGVGYIILPKIEQLLEKNTSDWFEIRSTLKLTLKYEGHSLHPEDFTLVNKLLSDLNPQDFQSLYTQYVNSPRWDDEDDNFDRMRVRAQELAVTFIEKHYDLTLLPLFFQGEQQNGAWFGEGIGNRVNDEQAKEFFRSSIESIHKIPQDKYNLVVLVGFIRVIKNQNLKVEFLRTVFQDTHFKSSTFQIAAMANPPAPIFDDLLELVKSGEFPVAQFISFQYGRALDHLQSNDVLRIFEALSNYSIDGKKTALSVLFMYCYNNEDHWLQTKELIRKLLHTRGLLEYSAEATLDKHKWSELCERCLLAKDDSLAEHLINDIVDLCSGNTFVSSVDFELKAILKILLQSYFTRIWPKLSEALLSDNDQFMIYFNLKGLLKSHINSYGPDKGVLFFGDLDEILHWCREKQPLAPNRLANMVPVFHETEPAKWHPFTSRLIDEFGNDDEFIIRLDANMGSFSWTGSIVPLLRNKKALFDALRNHKFPKIREWAQKASIELDDQIRKETNEDVERYL